MNLLLFFAVGFADLLPNVLPQVLAIISLKATEYIYRRFARTNEDFFDDLESTYRITFEGTFENSSQKELDQIFSAHEGDLKRILEHSTLGWQCICDSYNVLIGGVANAVAFAFMGMKWSMLVSLGIFFIFTYLTLKLSNTKAIEISGARITNRLTSAICGKGSLKVGVDRIALALFLFSIAVTLIEGSLLK